MNRRLWISAVAMGLIAAFLAHSIAAEKTPIKAAQEWSGSVEDEALAKDAPAVITNGKDFEKLWKAWKIEGKVPEVDFAKQLVVVSTTRGSVLRFGATLDEAGNLALVGLATRDLRPGFRYVLASVSREGVKSVNGKPLPE